MNTVASCPECSAEIPFESNAAAGDRLVCPDCSAELEVTSINPVTLELAADAAKEDWGE